jgi:hypothetical protein
MFKNDFINFLITYGPTPAGQSMYDEHVVKNAISCRVEPLSIESERVAAIVDALRADEPRSVILTGTAGDGKTWHCRKVFRMLGGKEEGWKDAECQIDYVMPSGRRLVIVKDLTQFADVALEDAIVEGLVEAIMGRSRDLYLIAANDGPLLRIFRRYARTNSEAKDAERAIRTLLKNDEVRTESLRLDLWNLSRQPHDMVFERLLNAMLDHDGWSGCKGCELDRDGTCVIQRNRELLRQAGDTGLRARLRDLIRIAADNDMHLPIRHVLLTIVNTLLGVSGHTVELMRCNDAMVLVNQKTSSKSNPYDNVFGLNLRSAKTYRAFTILSNFGIGRETNNSIDGLLLDEDPKADHDLYVANDPELGSALFEESRCQYRRGQGVDFEVFKQGMERQRRRLFFQLPPTNRPDRSDLDPWRLTVFMHAGEYLAFSAGLRAGKTDPRIRNRLITGLNRSYTGVMCDEGSHLWLAAPAANSQSRIGQVLDIKLKVGPDRNGRVYFDFDANGPHGALRMAVVRVDGRDIIESNPLQPQLFEYLLRVEGGSLPGSFSRQCYEELRQFRLRVAAALAKEGLLDSDGANIHLVALTPDGRLRESVIEVADATLLNADEMQ